MAFFFDHLKAIRFSTKASDDIGKFKPYISCFPLDVRKHPSFSFTMCLNYFLYLNSSFQFHNFNLSLSTSHFSLHIYIYIYLSISVILVFFSASLIFFSHSVFILSLSVFLFPLVRFSILKFLCVLNLFISLFHPSVNLYFVPSSILMHVSLVLLPSFLSPTLHPALYYYSWFANSLSIYHLKLFVVTLQCRAN